MKTNTGIFVWRKNRDINEKLVEHMQLIIELCRMCMLIVFNFSYVCHLAGGGGTLVPPPLQNRSSSTRSLQRYLNNRNYAEKTWFCIAECSALAQVLLYFNMITLQNTNSCNCIYWTESSAREGAGTPPSRTHPLLRHPTSNTIPLSENPASTLVMTRL